MEALKGDGPARNTAMPKPVGPAFLIHGAIGPLEAKLLQAQGKQSGAGDPTTPEAPLPGPIKPGTGQPLPGRGACEVSRREPGKPVRQGYAPSDSLKN